MNTNLNLPWAVIFLAIVVLALKWAYKRKLLFIEEDIERDKKIAQEEKWEVFEHEKTNRTNL